MIRFCKTCGVKVEEGIVECPACEGVLFIKGTTVESKQECMLKTVDLSMFLSRQESILTKYEDLSKLVPGTDKMSMRDFSLILDQYILQTAEELTETYTEIERYKHKGDNEEELLMEVIDTTMYTGTIICLLDNTIKNVNKKYEAYTSTILLKSPFDDINELESAINDITYKLIDIRRINPERKWHKPYKEITGIEVIERLMNLRNRFYGLLTTEFLLLNNYFTKYDVMKCIHNKQQFIIDLPVISKRDN